MAMCEVFTALTQESRPPGSVVLAQCMGNPGELDARAMLLRFHMQGLRFLIETRKGAAAREGDDDGAALARQAQRPHAEARLEVGEDIFVMAPIACP